jgi:hypothetical protein
MACSRSAPVDARRTKRWRAGLSASAALLLMLVAGCATPIQVERITPREVGYELTSNVISTGELSDSTEMVLHREALSERFRSDPEAAIASLHRTATAEEPDPDDLFALAEMSFRHAEDTGKHDYYLSAAVYAYAFLFPDDPAQRPSAFDPGFRAACDLYNRGTGKANSRASSTAITSPGPTCRSSALSPIGPVRSPWCSSTGPRPAPAVGPT